mmetsp:Transcript_12055/g.20674  ORF Transcript_12055/g.20674 Transcript_12055/m.20674 type:complete len:201 (+) Transcript_12055:543-1145(+)
MRPRWWAIRWWRQLKVPWMPCPVKSRMLQTPWGMPWLQRATLWLMSVRLWQMLLWIWQEMLSKWLSMPCKKGPRWEVHWETKLQLQQMPLVMALRGLAPWLLAWQKLHGSRSRLSSIVSLQAFPYAKLCWATCVIAMPGVQFPCQPPGLACAVSSARVDSPVAMASPLVVPSRWATRVARAGSRFRVKPSFKASSQKEMN